MAYITKSNAIKILKNIHLMSINLAGDVYKKQIFFFNRFEKNELLAFKELIKNPTSFVKDYYEPLSREDTRTYIYEKSNKKPAYHKDSECHLLHSEFRNVRIPESLSSANISVDEFRKWFILNLTNAFERGDYTVIQQRIRIKFGVEVNVADFVCFPNSDIEEFKNYDILDLEKKLDHLIKEAGQYYYKNKDILHYYSKQTFLAKQLTPLTILPGISISEPELRDFVNDYNKKYKEPVKVLLKEWYRLNYNPKLELKENILDSLNFKRCSSCFNNDQDYSDRIEF